MKPKGHSRLLANSTALIVATFATSSAFAASATWNGTTNATWANDTNWSATPAPGAVDTATFNNAGNANTTLDLGAGVTIGSIVFDTASAAYTLGTGAADSQALTLGNAGSLSLSATVANNQLVNASVNLSTIANSTATISNGSASLLTVAGSINAVPPVGNSLLTVGGSGNTTITGAINETGAGGSALLKTGAGTLTISNNGTYTGTGALGRIPATAAGFPLVAREGTLRFNGGTQTVTGELVIGGVVADGGAGQNAKIQMDAGSLAVSSWLSVGRGNGIGGVSSELVATNASVITAANFSAGFNGTNAANLSKGAITLSDTSSFGINAAGAFQLGESAGSNMTMTLNNSSSVTVNGDGSATNRYIGGLGTGTLNLNGSASFNDLGISALSVGYQTGTGIVNMTGGTFSHANGEVRVGASNANGAFGGGSGTFTMSGGTATVGSLTLARGNNNAALMNGTLTLSGGTLSSANDVTLGFAGAGNLGKLTVSGGTLNVGTAGTKWLMVGRWDTSKGQLDITSGSVNLYNNSLIKMNADGTTGVNVVNQSGGSVTFYGDAGTTVGGTGDLDLQRAGAAASNNTYNLNGGTLTVPKILSTAVTGTRTFNLNGGLLKPAVSTTTFFNLGTGTTRANVRDGGAKIDTNGLDVTAAQALLHSNVGGDAATDGGLTKSGAGTLTLSSTAHTYNGATLVNGGKLSVTGSLPATTAVSVANTATLTGTGTVNGATTVAVGGNVESGVAGAGKLALSGGLTFSGAGNINIGTLSNYVATTAVGTTALTPNGAAGAVVIHVGSLGTATVGNTYKLLDYTSLGGTGSGGFSLALPSRATGTTAFTATELTVTLTGFDFLKWTGSAGSAWNTASSNWKLNSNNSTTNYINNPGDSVLFDDSAGSNTIVDISTVDVTPASVIFNNSISKDYFVQGSKGITGVTSLVKNNTGILTLSTPNNYSGGTTLNAGTLIVDNASAIGTGTLTINGGSLDSGFSPIALTTNNAQNWNTDFTYIGSSDLNLGTGAVALSANRIITTGFGSLTAGGVISGTGFSLTKNGDGTLALGGVNTYTGGTTLNAGTLQINPAAGAAANGAINLNGGAFVTNATANNFGFAPTINQTVDMTWTKSGGSQVNFTGTLTGTGNLLDVSTTAGRLYMNATVSGITQLNVTSGAMGFDLNVGNRGGGAPVNVSNGASLWLANATNTVSNNITLNGGSGQGATGAIFMEGAASPVISGPINLAGGDSSFGGNTAASNVTVSGVISGAALNKIGVNKYTFSGANTYTGSTTVNAGTLAAGVATVPNVSGPFGNNSAIVFGNVAGAILDITGFDTQVGSITGGGATGGNITLGAATLTTGADNTSPAAYAGAISGTGGLTKTGGGTEILSGANSYTGDTTINSGTLVANRNNNAVNPVTSALGNPQVAHNITVNSTATLNFANGDTFGGANTVVVPTLVINAGGTVTNTVNNFTSLGPVTLNGGTLTTTGGAIGGYQSFSFSGDVTVGGAMASTISVTGPGNAFNGFHLGTNTTFNVADATASAASDLDVSAPLINRNQTLTGTGGLTKTGPGKMTLSGINTYTGDTIVSAGTLSLVNLGLADAADVRLTTGATLNLTFAAGTPDTIDELYIDGVQQASGTWGAPGSGAAHTSALISGTGILSVTTGTALSTYATWATTNAGGQTANLDFDNDGVKNGVEYFMGATGSTFTANPAIASGKVVWPKDPAFSGTYTVQTSPDLTIWTNVSSTVVGNTIQYTVPTGQGKLFVRLDVVPN